MMKCSMDQNDRNDAVDGPVVSEGGRSPSTLTPGQGTPAAKDGAALGPLALGQRWSATRKREVVLRLMRGEAAELLSRELGLPMFKLAQWRQKAEAALEGRAVQRCAASLVGPGCDRSGQNGSGGREIGFPDRRNSDSWGGNRGGGCRDRVCAAAGTAGGGA